MRVALDEGVPEDLSSRLPGHDVQSVRQMGLKGTKNGKLLFAIEAGGFNAFISNDKRLEFDQNLLQRSFSILLLNTNHWPTIQQRVESIVTALETGKPGTVTRVDCGNFIPRRFRNL